MNNTTFIRFCRFGFWFRVYGFGIGIWIRTPFERKLVKHRRGRFLAQWIAAKGYRP